MPGFTPSRVPVSAVHRAAFAVVVGAGLSLAGLNGVAQAQVDVSGTVTVAGPTAPVRPDRRRHQPRPAPARRRPGAA